MKRTIVAALGAALFFSGSAYAHHSYGTFFLDQTVAIDGVLDKIIYANPHTILTVTAKDGQTYTAEWGALFQLSRWGVGPDSLKPGDEIVVSGCPNRDPAVHRLAVLKEITRPMDGWRWARSQPRTN